MSDELHARVETAWSRAWIGFAVLTALGLGLVAMRLFSAAPLAPPDPPPRVIDGPLSRLVVDAPPASSDGPPGADPDDEALRLAADLRAGSEGKAPDHEAAAELYRRTCAATGDARACTRSALIDGLLRDLSVAPTWIDRESAPRSMLMRACTGDAGGADPLACAAVTLISPRTPAPAELESAATVALDACRDRFPEACYLAAAPQATTATTAMETLRVACESGDLPSCLYQWRRGGDSAHGDALLRACTDLDGQPRLAAACRARAADSPRPRELARWACEAGDCAGIDDKAVLQKACEAGQVNGCAEALVVLRPAGMTAQAWKQTRARALKLAPALELQLETFADVPAAAAGYIDACLLGSPRGCEHTLKALPPDRDAAKDIRSYAARLAEPL